MSRERSDTSQPLYGRAGNGAVKLASQKRGFPRIRGGRQRNPWGETSERRERLREDCEISAAEKGEGDRAHAGRRRLESRAGLIDRDRRRMRDGKPIDAGTDRRRRDRGQSVFGGDRERRAIGRAQEVALTVTAVAPARSYRVDHVTGGHAPRAGDHGGAGGASVVTLAQLAHDLRPAGSMHPAVNPATTGERAVGRVDDGVDVERRDVGSQQRYRPGAERSLVRVRRHSDG